MRNLFLIAALFSGNALAFECPDIDNDGVTEPCFDQDGQYENGDGDNCPTIYNPSQGWGKSYLHTLGVGWEWVKNKNDGGVACSLDVDGNGGLTRGNYQDDFNRINDWSINYQVYGAGLYPVVDNAIGDFNGNNRYDLYDLCVFYKLAYKRQIFLWIGNVDFLNLCYVP